jgi:RNA-directed DNA polymerase
MKDRLLEAVFDYKRWVDLIDRADTVKGINKGLLRAFSSPEKRSELLALIVSRQYHVSPPHVILIPKDKPNEFREVKANENLDRIVLTLINDSLFELYGSLIHKNCKSYQKGLSSVETVQKAVETIKDYNGFLGYKVDLSKYFDSVKLEYIDAVFDDLENRLEISDEPIIALLREYYHSDWLFDVNGKLTQQFTSLKQGCAVAAFLADVILHDIDEKMTAECSFYVRYSDDMLLIGKNAERALSILENELQKYGLKLNPKKIEKLNSENWFTFLGFAIKGGQVTLSHNRVKKFQKEIDNRTFKSKQKNLTAVKRNLLKWLYGGQYNWASSCFAILNVKKDIDELNKYILDALRATVTRKTKIGGLGTVNGKDYTISRGVGTNVKSNREKTEKLFSDYKSVGCLIKDFRMSKAIFETVIREMI